MLFYPDRRIDVGTAREVLTDEALENAYGIPASMLKERDRLTREALRERYKLLSAR